MVKILPKVMNSGAEYYIYIHIYSIYILHIYIYISETRTREKVLNLLIFNLEQDVMLYRVKFIFKTMAPDFVLLYFYNLVSFASVSMTGPCLFCVFFSFFRPYDLSCISAA